MDILPHNKLLDLSGKTAIVTGGSIGIGFGISYRLAEAGAKVMVAGRNSAELDRVVADLTAKGFTAKSVSADVSKEEDVKKMIDETVKAFGGVDILVNNAGVYPFATLDKLTPDIFDKTIAINLRGVFLTVKFVSEQMIRQGRGGKIINVTSIDALHPSMAGLAHYDASKHGVWGFTKNVALDLAKHGIWVNAVAPGGVSTPGTAQGVKPEDFPRFPDAPKMEVAMGRMGVPDDIGKVVLFLASDLSSYMTGAQVVVDGGYLLK